MQGVINMASIAKHKTGWRAQLYVGGVRDSAVFFEKFEAETWAKKRESELKILRDSIINSRRIDKNKRAFLDVTDLYSENEIIGTSIPLPETSGIYFLIKDNVIVYVGQSKNVHRRLQEHLSSKAFDRINIIECSINDLNRLETLYIKKLKPILNIVQFKTPKEDDLRLQFLTA
jgi:predicted GIY-YIG superfamily endonuclease